MRKFNHLLGIETTHNLVGMKFPRRRILLIGAIATLHGAQAHAAPCELVWKVAESGEYSAAFTVPNAATWSHDRLPGAIRDATPPAVQTSLAGGGTRFDARGVLIAPERKVGSSILDWLRSQTALSVPGGCDVLRVELRTEWRYWNIPSESVHRYPKGDGPEAAKITIQRLSSLQDPAEKREYFGVEIEATASASAQSQPEGVQNWLTGVIQETDLREPGMAWDDRPLEVKFPTGLRGEISVVAGGYAPSDQSSFGTGVHGALASELLLSDTLFWKTSYLSTRAVFGQFGSGSGEDAIGLSIFDLGIDTGIHWRPMFQANDVDSAGVRNFVGLSLTPGLHHVWAKSAQPIRVSQSFTAPLVDLGFAWGAYNRKRNVLFDLEFHFLTYLTTAAFGPAYEFGISVSIQ